MMNSKDTIKEIGTALRSSNVSHQALLRARLEAQAPERAIPTPTYSFWKPSFFLTSAAVMVALVIATWPKPPEVYTADSSPLDTVTLEAGFGEGSGRGLLGTLEEALDYAYEPTALSVAPSTTASPGEIIDYENEHGSMLDVNTKISLWSTEDDLVTPVQELFNSLGGHVSGISQYGMAQPTTLTGLVPADSYFMFRDQLRDLVSADKYMTEVLNATDLIPSAIDLDETIAEVTEAIEVLKAEIAKAENANTKAALQRQLDTREAQLENLTEARGDLDENVEYVKVSVTVTEIPSFWETREAYDLHNLVMGMEKPGSFLQRALVNVLIVGFWSLQILSIAIWFLIPLAIWLIYRRGQRRLWRELE